MGVFLICLFSIFIGCVSTGRDFLENVTVSAPVGEITGTAGLVEFNGEFKEVSAFLGIPYAEPPVGELRFARPVKLRALSSPYLATHHRPQCPQSSNRNAVTENFRVAEDCLHLNVFAPGRRVDAKRRYVVMVWIYGGAFAFGGADIYSGEILSAVNDVIVVTFNYRMNVFGFLRSPDGSAPGNMGLWDQHMAIQWVHDNIGAFGGDVNKVTLFGESAGAASAIYQAMYAGNKGLIHRVIAQSGSPLAVWALQTAPKKNFEQIVNRTQCYKHTHKRALECLLRKPANDILTHIEYLDTFFPVVDGEFIKHDPHALFDDDSEASLEAMALFSGVDFLSGVNNKDGAAAVNNYWAELLKKMLINIADGVSKFVFDNIYVPTTLMTLYPNTNPVLTKSVIHAYTNWSNPQDGLRVRDNMVDMSSDIYFFVPAIRAAKKHGEITTKSSTFFYEFVHKPALAPKPAWLEGATHTMEIPYVFGLPNSMKVVLGLPPDYPVVVPADEIQLAQRMMHMWSSFAKTGNPNAGSTAERQLPTWPQYDTGNQSYLQLSTAISTSSVKRRLAANRVAFWTDVVPTLRRCHEQPADATSDNVSPTVKDQYNVANSDNSNSGLQNDNSGDDSREQTDITREVNDNSGGQMIHISISCCAFLVLVHSVGRGL